MSKVYFIRHAETAMAGRFCGHSDPALNAQGQQQAATLRHLQGLECVYSSDLRRAVSTAEALGLPVTLRPALREIYFGQWEGLSWEEIERADPAYAHEWIARYPDLPAPGGESFAEFEARVVKEIDWLLGQRGPIAVVTHRGVLRVVLQHWHGCSDKEAWQRTQSYCCVVTFQGEEQ
jgi:broad specificity phosphatase PhoE